MRNNRINLFAERRIPTLATDTPAAWVWVGKTAYKDESPISDRQVPTATGSRMRQGEIFFNEGNSSAKITTIPINRFPSF